nr:MAG TPA: hypothetical protein [Caudoviricetes sp.]
MISVLSFLETSKPIDYSTVAWYCSLVSYYCASRKSVASSSS